MIRKYVYGNPFETDAVIVKLHTSDGKLPHGAVDLTEGFCFQAKLKTEDIVYGLGEANRGINKRGYRYVSNCTDDPYHTEDKCSLYGAHNFLIVSGEESYGIFVDYPSKLLFDIGYTQENRLEISCQEANLFLYVIEGTDAYDVVRQFRKIIGRSYIPPKFAFGFGQSRWGYKTKEDFEDVAEKYRENRIPLDMIYLDIDYMQAYKDFTINREEFPDFPAFVKRMKARNIRLVPIIDAGIKVEEGYFVYEEGAQKQFFCRRQDGSAFVAAVWPGEVHFPDVLNPEAREWFGGYYRILTEQGIEGFWNDMNEPAIFYTPEGVEDVEKVMQDYLAKPREERDILHVQQALSHLSNREADYKNFYHCFNGTMVRHDRVHNLYGFHMTRAAGEALEKIVPDKRFLLFSRSSYIGMHRYGGIWTGDNASWWSHILLNLKMLPSLNMCGFLYVGADLGGFGSDTTRELLLRWLALGVFTPLMRNHSAFGTREQECYQFERMEDFRHILEVRYRLIPYLYSEYMKAALSDDILFKPLAFLYPKDRMAARVEDQLILGNEIMIAPVYTQNANGRHVYLPEEMLLVKFMPDGTFLQEKRNKGHHYIEIALNEVVLFIRKGKCIPLADAAEHVEALDTDNLTLIGYRDSEYELYEDDGVHKDYGNPVNWRIVK